MSRGRTAALVAGALLVGMVIGQAAPVQAQLDKILKGGAVLVLVDQLSGPIDRFINTITLNRSHGYYEATKVVPILTIGKGTYAGAVQVSGPRNLVDRVRAVAQLETSTRAIANNEIRVKALIPISTRNASDLSSLSRVKGVGVSALIDARL